MKTILISGGSDGLGKVIAARLAPNHNVVILSPHEDKLRAAAAELGCAFQVCDVRDYAQVEKVVSEAGAVDVLINNAGLWIEGPLDQNAPARIHEVLEVNTLGTINLTKAVAPGMKQQKSGLIINVISQAGLHAKAERSVYTASKWAITGFTKSMREELAPFGVGVSGLFPGKLKTGMFKKMGLDKNLDDALAPDEVAKVVEFMISLENPTLLPEVGVKNIAN